MLASKKVKFRFLKPAWIIRLYPMLQIEGKDFTDTLSQHRLPSCRHSENNRTKIVVTNLGAVILAIMAQKTANDIGRMYREVFTADFYMTVESMTTFRSFLIEEARNDGKPFNR